MENKEIQEERPEKICRDKGQWFVVNTLSGHENKVKNTIEKHLLSESDINVYEILIPTEKVSEVRQGKKTTTTRKFFPGYILVRMDLYAPETRKLDEKSWYFIRQTQGVIGFVGSGDRPIPLSTREIDALLQQSEGVEERPRPKINFELGELVRIKDGAFENFEGTVEGIDQERGKLNILVSIFGRSTPVELEFWQVEREA
ncbi:MAG: transcription termination/antitermination factor NusG [Victivallales bacterium]|nr:transcription termination/antitermination factor NusG [Victivallales bacterium]